MLDRKKFDLTVANITWATAACAVILTAAAAVTCNIGASAEPRVLRTLWNANRRYFRNSQDSYINVENSNSLWYFLLSNFEAVEKGEHHLVSRAAQKRRKHWYHGPPSRASLAPLQTIMRYYDILTSLAGSLPHKSSLHACCGLPNEF